MLELRRSDPLFRTPTTIIVGAGASKDYGLPLGSELRGEIAQLIDIRFDDFGSSLETGDYKIVESLRTVARERNLGTINTFLPACRQMAAAMPMALSIDNYLDAHQNDADVLLCGKLAITKAILDAERSSTLTYDYRREDSFDLAALQNTWLARLVNVLTEGVRKEAVETIFNNLTIISFNYDRCIKAFLRYALQIYYGLTDAEADQLICQLNVYHPYGSVGPLPFEARPGVSFGSDPGGEFLLRISKGIKTFTERVDDETMLEEMRSNVSKSEQLLFIGFGFHRQNIQLISPELPRSCSRVFATTFGISDSDCEIINNEILGRFSPEHRPLYFHKLAGNSANLFEHYWRSITA